jgi:transcriptional regulator with XRE-family HTH domain
MDATPVKDPPGREATLSLILRTIRKRRGFRSVEVARLMKMAHRTYQRFEAGEMGVDFPLIQQFADVVHADAWGIFFAVEMRSLEFALFCAENQAATTLFSTLRRFHLKSGKDIARLDTRSLFIVFSKAFDKISERAREYDADLEQWMFDGTLNGEPGDESEPDPDDTPDEDPQDGQA